jgi:hypothetical protein
MKTTVDLDAALFKTARKRAIDEHRPFRAVLNDALRAYLGTDGHLATPRPAPRRRRTRSQTAATGDANVAEAGFWAIVNDRSRWDELFGDRLQKVEDDIAWAAADWKRRNSR